MPGKRQVWRNLDKMISYSIIGTKSLITYCAGEEMVFNLEKTDQNHIFMRRRRGIPTFLLKVENKLFYADVPGLKRLGDNTNGNEHLCYSCIHSRATIEELGGCCKVRDCEKRIYLEEGNNLEDALDLSKRIEKYPFIKYGYETFGLGFNKNVLAVEECVNFEPFNRSGCISIANMREMIRIMDEIKKILKDYQY